MARRGENQPVLDSITEHGTTRRRPVNVSAKPETRLQVSVIIPTHDRREKLLRLLESIGQSDLDPDQWEVIVVCDNCTDGTPEALKENFSNVRVLQTPQASEGNLSGSAVARHLGAQAAIFPFLCFIDDDNVIAPDMLRTLGDELSRNPTIGALGPLMLRWPDGTRVWSAGMRVNRMHFNHYIKKDHELSRTDDRGLLAPCDFVPNVYCTTKATLTKVPFDYVSFPHNGSELDWSLRLRDAGLQVRVTMMTTTWHDIGYRSLTTRIDQPGQVRDQSCARIRIRRRHRRTFGPMIWFWLAWFMPISTYFFLRFLVERRVFILGRAYIKGTIEGLSN